MGKLALIVFLASLAAYGQSGDLQRALEQYQRTEYQGTLDALKLQSNQDPRVWELAGKSAFMLADFKKASEYFEKAAALDGGNSGYFHWLGKAFGRRAETASFINAPRFASECRKAFEKAVQLDPKNLEALNDLLEYYLEAPGILGGGTEKATKIAERIAELDPVEKHFAQARLAEKKKEYSAAEQHLRRASELAPQQIGRVIDLARFLAKHGRVQESELAFQKAAKLAPDSPKLLFGRAQVYVETKRNLDQAKQMLQRYLQSTQLTPDDPSKDEARKLLRQAQGG